MFCLNRKAEMPSGGQAFLVAGLAVAADDGPHVIHAAGDMFAERAAQGQAGENPEQRRGQAQAIAPVPGGVSGIESGEDRGQKSRAQRPEPPGGVHRVRTAFANLAKVSRV